MSRIAPLHNSLSQRSAGEGPPPENAPGISDGLGGGGAPSKPGTTTTSKPPKTRLFDTARFRSRVSTSATDMPKKSKTVGSGTVFVVLLITGVSLGLLILGIFMLYIGDEKYIVDVIALGALCVVMGVTSFILGMVLVMKPLYNKRKHEEEQEEEEEEAERQLSAEDPGSSPSTLMTTVPSARTSVTEYRPEPNPGTSQEPQPGKSRGPQPSASRGAPQPKRSRAPSTSTGPPPASDDVELDHASARGRLRPSSPYPPPMTSSTDEAERSWEDGSPSSATPADQAELGGAGGPGFRQMLEDDIRALL